MNEHESVRAMLPLAAAGLLGPGELRRVEEHARMCELCRTDLETWSAYAQGLRKLPQPSAPAGLMERTRARIIQQHAVAAGRRRQSWLLGALVAFGWTNSLAFWVVARALTGGVFTVMGVNWVNGVAWSLGSTVLAWTTAAAAAIMLGRSREMRRFL
jgi:predicted anti-sigma-YlaC factor YlaD